MPTNNAILTRLGLRYPIIQVPMADPTRRRGGHNAGGLGSLVWVTSRLTWHASKSASSTVDSKPFNINMFCHTPDAADAQREIGWLQRLQPWFAEFSAEAPRQLDSGYDSFVGNQAMLDVLLEERPPVVSFHFGLPDAVAIAALQQAGIFLMGCATSLEEARAIEAAGLDAIVAQGYEAGGHRGLFDPKQESGLLLDDLLAQLKDTIELPVVATGGLMDGKDISRVLLPVPARHSWHCLYQLSRICCTSPP